jgi:predicted regulator of Ras-like GTPase activity (Roadblock/LC7/MglB family)
MAGGADVNGSKLRSPYALVLADLSRQRGVVGSFVVSERDGIAVDASVQLGVDSDAVAALAASLHRKARLASRAAGHGEVTFLHLEAERGRVCAAGRDDLVLVTICDTRVNVGLLRVEMLKAARTLA